MSASRPVVAFDLDGTLIRGDCVGRLLARLIKRSWWRRLLALPLLPLLPLMRWSTPATRISRLFLWVASVGRRSDQWRFDERQHVAMMLQDRPRWVIAPALQRMQMHLQRGDRVIVITGAFESLARLIVLEVLQLDSVEVLGSRGRWRHAALHMDVHCFARHKLHRLTAAGVSLPLEAAYSDSLHDLPLLAASRQPVLVGGSSTLAASVRRRLPQLQWINRTDTPAR